MQQESALNSLFLVLYILGTQNAHHVLPLLLFLEEIKKTEFSTLNACLTPNYLINTISVSAIRFSMSRSTTLFSLGKSLGVVIARGVLSLTFNCFIKRGIWSGACVTLLLLQAISCKSSGFTVVAGLGLSIFFSTQ